MSISRKTPALVAGLALASSGLAVTTATTASANPAGTDLVISEAYGGGNNSGAAFRNDFIEIHNPTDAPISLSGKSLQYRSAGGSGTSTNVFALPAVDVAPGDHYLVSGAGGTTNGDPLPTPDATSTLNLSGTGGQIYLANSATGIDPGTGPISNPSVIDFLGWGTSATSFETAAAPATANATSSTRDEDATDTDDNSVDFSTDDPTPGEAFEPAPPATIVDATIAEVQGEGDASPYAGVANTYVRTRGVVTAAYPAGGFFSFVIQTEGTGGATDATPGASDGLWVRQTSGAIAVEIGDFVEVTAPVEENFTLTRLSYTPTDPEQGLTELADPHTAPVPLVGDFPTTDAEREAHEGELLDVTGQSFTVTDNFDTNRFAEIGLATGDEPLIHPLDIGAPGSPEAAAVAADDEERAVTLDDGSSSNYTTGATADLPVPWLTPTNPIRVGSATSLHAPVILDFQFSAWRFQPTEQVTDEGADVATFANTRSEDTTPQPVGGDLKLATFNVLNYFNTTGVDYVAGGGSCTYFEDRDGDPVTTDDCGASGPRGAAEAEDLERQQAKIVAAINTLDADIVSLEEIENSVKLGEPRDDALGALVTALNADAGSTRWAFVPSPDASELPAVDDQDVIRTAFIYNPDTVATIGTSDVLAGDPNFTNAREPLAQAFKPAGAADDAGFAVVVNHFKSKGNSTPPQTGNDNEDTGNGAGAYNGDRTRQAQSLATFAGDFAESRELEKVFLAGDFNSYSQEDPMQVLYDAGFTGIESDTEGEATYSFDGLYGSLDHVLANDAALADVTGADIWNINSVESVAFEYSRHNNNVTDFYAPDVFRASDHNPEIVGIEVADEPEEPVESTTTATANPDTVKVKKGKSRIDVTVTADGATPTGEVVVLNGSTELGSAELDENGEASVQVGPFTTVGTKTLTVRYEGDDAVAASETTTSVEVTKRTPKITVDRSPQKVVVGKTKVTMKIEVDAEELTPRGRVEVRLGGEVLRAGNLDNRGRVTLQLPVFRQTGDKTVRVVYFGNNEVDPGLKEHTIRVVRR